MGVVLGISCHYHDSAAALVVDGRVVAAAQEERFNRDKYSQVFPIEAINSCLQVGGISIYDVDKVAFYEKPYLKFARVMSGHVASWPWSWPNFIEMMPSWLEERLSVPHDVRQKLGFEGEVLFLKHHLAHAASTFYASGFEQAAILTVDGIGEYASTTWGVGRGTDIRLEQELHYPNSVGLLYAIVSTWLGFRVFEGEGKVMALAALGQPSRMDDLGRCVELRPDGSFRLDPRYFTLNRGKRMYHQRFVDLFGPPRAPDAPFEQRHLDVAATLQRFTEQALLAMARHVQARTGMTRLTMAGGVFLNVVANSRILKETPFEQVFIQPAAGDAGAALGAALYVSHRFLGDPRGPAMRSANLGPSFESRTIQRLLKREGLSYRQLDDDALATYVAERIAGGAIVGWFRGRMEYGPRALGARSILADVRDPDIKDKLNARVKHREPFRPYGVAVLEDRADEFFDLGAPSPFMLLVANARPQTVAQIPSAVHVDGTSRLQTVTEADNGVYAKVVREFDRLTGVPMIINTSFNVREPIVCTPQDALRTFQRSQMDVLVLEDLVVERSGQIAGADGVEA